MLASPSETWIPAISLSPSFWKPVLPVKLLEPEPRVAEGLGLSQETHWLVVAVRVVLGHVHQLPRVQRVALGVQRVAGVLDDSQVVGAGKGDIVKGGVYTVALVDQRQLAGVGRRRSWTSSSTWPSHRNPRWRLRALVSPVSSK